MQTPRTHGVFNTRFSRRWRRALVAALTIVLLSPQLLSVATAASTARLFFSPSSRTVTNGNTFTMKVVVSTGGQAINAAEATVNFPKDKLQISSVSKNGIFSLWAQDPSYSNGNGTLTFSGGLPSPGYNGSSGTILTITFQAKKTGTATISYSGAQVLANDGFGTNVLLSASSGTVTIEAASQPTNTNTSPPPTNTNTAPEPTRSAPTIASSTHPDVNAWSSVRTIEATWTAGDGVLGYNALFDQNADTFPGENDGGLTTTFSRSDLLDGEWYLHVRARYESGWSSVSHFRFRIDGTAPTAFTIGVADRAVTDRTATLTFATTDVTSGIAKYELLLDEDEPVVATSPLTLSNLAPGAHSVVVHAIDQAGLRTAAETTITVEAPSAPIVVLTVPERRLMGVRSAGLPTILVGEVLQLSGVAPLGSTLHISVFSEESVFEFPVDDILDPEPIEPAPAGFGAWKVDILPALDSGDHEIRAYITNPDGSQSEEAEVIRFHVAEKVVRIGNFYITFPLFLTIVATVFVFLLALVIVLLIFVIRERRMIHTIVESTKKVERTIQTEEERSLRERLEKIMGGKPKPPSAPTSS